MAIRNARALEEVFGRWPSFHDAEVVAIRMGRGNAHDDAVVLKRPWLEADVHVWETTREITPSGHYLQRNHTLVTLRFTGIEDLTLAGFNLQNVLWDLELTDISDRQLEILKWQVNFPSSFGVEGSFLCADVEVLEVRPFESGSPGDGPGLQKPAQPTPN